jgi:ABC-type phosphate transport system permease subunit
MWWVVATATAVGVAMVAIARLLYTSATEMGDGGVGPALLGHAAIVAAAICVAVASAPLLYKLATWALR